MPHGFSTRRASHRASTMPSRGTHHNDDANNTMSNCSPGNGKAIALAHRNCRRPPSPATIADRMSASFVSIPTTRLGSSAYWNVNRPSAAPTSSTLRPRNSTASRIARGSTPNGSTWVAMRSCYNTNNTRACNHSRHAATLWCWTGRMGTGRLEAFSDGVIAIIITIMVLEMKVPRGDSLADLLPVLPVFLSYVLSFVYVGIYWN